MHDAHASLQTLAVDAVLLAAIVIGASVEMQRITGWAQAQWYLPESWTKWTVVVGAALLPVPFGLGLVRMARYLGFELTSRAFPVAQREQLDLAAVGKTLAEISLRGLTGATVVAIQRGDESVLVPSGRERLLAGDVLAIAGTHDAVEAAKELLSAVS